MELCSIASGSSGNCIYVGTGHASVLVDVGLSGKRIESGLNSIDRTTRDVDGILITHEHSDHIQGLGVLARKYGVPIYATAGTREAAVSPSSPASCCPLAIQLPVHFLISWDAVLDEMQASWLNFEHLVFFSS